MFKKILGFLKTKTGIVLIIIAIGGIWFSASRSHQTTYQFVTVDRGSITETVSVTGNVTTTRSVDLAFENGGTITAVSYREGDHVNAGTAIARLDTQDLKAQLAEAQANVDSETATLKNMEAGPTPQSVAVSETAVASAEQTLENSYGNVPNTIAGAYANMNDAVRTQLATFFTNAETTNPELTFAVSDSEIINNVTFDRAEASVELNTWQNEDHAITETSASSTLDTALQNALAHLAVAKTLLTTTLNAIVNATNNMSATTAATYKADVTTGMNEVNTAIGNVNALAQNIASEKASVAQAAGRSRPHPCRIDARSI